MYAISFSLWGDNPLYWKGAIRNAELAPKIYGPNWTCYFYYDSKVPDECIDRLNSLGALTYFMGDSQNSWLPGFWKHRAVLEPEVERLVVRDADSRPSLRERSAVDEWIDSGLPFHIMRDHPYHCVPILGGTWGATRHIGLDIVDMFTGWNYDFGDKQVDQIFLKQRIWPLVANQCLIHDEISPLRNAKCKPFPMKRNGNDFIGAIINPDDSRRFPEHHNMIRNTYA